jgi:hypothetical protein
MNEPSELTEDELQRQEGDELPSREAMSIIPIGDPSELVLPPAPDDPMTAYDQPVEPDE